MACLIVSISVLFLMACAGPRPEDPGPRDAPQPQHSERTEGDVRQVYHVQVFLTDERTAAEQRLQEALSWWQSQPGDQRPSIASTTSSPGEPVYIRWKAPFYRVRIGPFATRRHAETVVSDARSAFPDAFIVPERIQGR